MIMLQKISMILLWIARILGCMIVLLFLTFGLGEGLGKKPLSSNEIAGFACLGFMLWGVLVAYWRTIPGCLLMIGGYIGFTLYDKDFNIDNPFIAFPVIAVIYLLSWFLGRCGSTKQTSLSRGLRSRTCSGVASKS
jgi:hypothetical protein